MTIYFTGCTHFGHENIIKLAQRPFKDAEHMNEELIERWNRTVSAKDTVYHLGDFAFRGKPAHEYSKYLNGTIITIQGNHDPKNWGELILNISIGKQKLVLCHYPLEEWEGFYRGAYHVHCHQHKSEPLSAKNRFNVTVEAWDYTPVSFEQLVELQ